MSKMGVIYTEAFLDSKDGILKFATLITKLNSEFYRAQAVRKYQPVRIIRNPRVATALFDVIEQIPRVKADLGK